ADHFQPGQALVRDFPVDQLFRDHAHHLAAALQHGIGDDAHQADVAAAVDQLQALAGDAVAHGHGSFGVDRLAAGIGAAIDADRAHGSGSGGVGWGGGIVRGPAAVDRVDHAAAVVHA